MSRADFEPLSREVDLLGRALGQAILRFSGTRLYDLEETVRTLTRTLRRDPQDHEAKSRLLTLIQGLSLSQAEGLVRAFSDYFHLVNLAEERHRVRINREREAAASAEIPRRESLRGMVRELQQAGWELGQVLKLLEVLELYLTFTAHPTETRRRTIRHHLSAITETLTKADRGEPYHVELQARVDLLWTTQEVRRAQPTVADEAKGGLYYLPTTLWEALPVLSHSLAQALNEYYGSEASPVLPFRFRSWIGGDRDGNPNVGPEVTDWVQKYALELVARRYIEDVDRLIAELSVYSGYLPIPREIKNEANAVAETLPLPERFADEPYRRFLMGVRYRLRSLIGEQPGPAYRGRGELLADLELIEHGLRQVGLHPAAEVFVAPLLVRARSYGLSGVLLDLREESGTHRQAVAELLEVGRGLSGYPELSAAERLELLTQELTSPRPLAPVGYVPRGRALSVALGALANWRARGSYIISMSREPADILEVFILARELGIYRPGTALPFDVVPLFETLKDLQGAPEVVGQLLALPLFLAHLKGRGGFEVMIGYSDSNKDAGYLAANWALYQAQDKIAAVGRQAGVPIYFFHGRGTSTARGGGPAGRALASLPPGTVGRRIRITEQGEALADRYAHPDLAFRNLEQLLYHFVLTAAREQRGEAAQSRPEWSEALARVAQDSAEFYRALLGRPGFFSFFESLTPIREIATLKIASRPVYRHGRISQMSDLRAIPWVMSWTQVRANLPGWYGLGNALAELPLPLLREMYQEWPFFASVMEGAAMSLAKSDLNITEAYLPLVTPDLAREFFPLLQGEYQKTIELVQEIGQGPLLHPDSTLARSIELRNPYVDPLNYLQVELLARYRKLPLDHPDRTELERTLTATLLGISAGLRNTG